MSKADKVKRLRKEYRLTNKVLDEVYSIRDTLEELGSELYGTRDRVVRIGYKGAKDLVTQFGKTEQSIDALTYAIEEVDDRRTEIEDEIRELSR